MYPPKLVRRLAQPLLNCQGEKIARIRRDHPRTAGSKNSLNKRNRLFVQPDVFGGPATLANPPGRSCLIDTVAALQHQIHNDLRTQHPEWVEPNGESPMCDFYEARLAQLLDSYAHTESDKSVAAVQPGLEEQTFINDLAVSPS